MLRVTIDQFVLFYEQWIGFCFSSKGFSANRNGFSSFAKEKSAIAVFQEFSRNIRKKCMGHNFFNGKFENV